MESLVRLLSVEFTSWIFHRIKLCNLANIVLIPHPSVSGKDRETDKLGNILELKVCMLTSLNKYYLASN